MLGTLATINRPTVFEDHELNEIDDLLGMMKIRIANQDKRKYILKHGPVTPLPVFQVIEVNEVTGVQDMISRLSEMLKGADLTTLYIDCRGHELGRKGTFHILQLYSQVAGLVWFVHVSQLGDAAFTTKSGGETLKDILESTTVKKVVWDCRGATDALSAFHGVKLSSASVIDL